MLRANIFRQIILIALISPGVSVAVGEGGGNGIALENQPFLFSVLLILVCLIIYRLIYRGNNTEALLPNAPSIPCSSELSHSLINISSDAIIVADKNLYIINFNKAAEELFGYRLNEIEKKPILGTLMFSDNEDRFIQFLQYCENKDDSSLHPIHQVLRAKDGTELVTSTRMAISRGGDDPQYIFHIQDKSTLVEVEDKLHFATFNDELTGLPNRHIAAQHIQQGIYDAKRNNRNLVVMKIGLDRFKHINDSLGHDIGDNLLIQISCRLKEGNRRGDLVSRINGDQFVVTLIDVDKTTNMDRLVRKYVDGFETPFVIDEHILHISVSIGIACYPNDAIDVDGLMRNAESAMFQAKQKGGTNFRYFSQEMRTKSTERLYLENELRRAIMRDEFSVFYQPQVNLKSGKIIGVEALIRWKHPKLGMVPPIKFIPVAEEIGLISEIGQWVLKRACTEMTQMRKERLDILNLSINLSANQFMEGDLVEKIASTLYETGFPPENLELEITESLFVEDVENVVDVLNIFSAQGIRISMDDFGTGYSSLSYLKKFPINTIKVDRSFVKDIASDKDDASIVIATIQMAHSLSLDIVAEGVETEEQLEFLLSQKCDKIQGFYFSRPLSYKALVNLLEENRQIELNSDKICLISGYR